MTTSYYRKASEARMPPLKHNDYLLTMKRYDDVLVALRRIIRATDLHSKRLSKESGLTAPQLLILQTLRNEGELTAGEVARKVSLSQATVTTIIDRLEKREYVIRERSSQDKRKVFLHLSDAGRDALGNAPKPLQDWEPLS